MNSQEKLQELISMNEEVDDTSTTAPIDTVSLNRLLKGMWLLRPKSLSVSLFFFIVRKLAILFVFIFKIPTIDRAAA